MKTEIKVPIDDALHAYLPFLPAVKSSQPHDPNTDKHRMLVQKGGSLLPLCAAKVMLLPEPPKQLRKKRFNLRMLNLITFPNFAKR